MNKDMLVEEIVEEAVTYIQKLRKSYMQIEMEYYWEEGKNASALLVNLSEGLNWLKECYSTLIEGREEFLLSEDYLEVQRRELELFEAMEEKDWLGILDFLRFKFKGYLIFIEQAYLKLIAR